MKLKEQYPRAYQDDRGTVWVSEDAALSADWSYAHGDAFLDDILGWGWEDAEENWALCQREAKCRAFWSAHPHLRNMRKFVRTRYGFLSMFSRTVWRDWYGRISWSTAWEVSRDIWLK